MIGVFKTAWSHTNPAPTPGNQPTRGRVDTAIRKHPLKLREISADEADPILNRTKFYEKR